MSARTFDHDLFVIGAGSGGVRAARIAARHGARVAIAEARFFGGTCVNVGCVPKKLMVQAAAYRHAFEDARGFGWAADVPAHDWGALVARRDAEVARLNTIYRHLLEGAGVTIFEARATLLDAHTVELHDVPRDGGESADRAAGAPRRVTADKIVIATGGAPVLPDEPGARELGITSDGFFALKKRPDRALVVGGGYIAVELASVLHGLGARVTLAHRGGRLLRGFDDDVREALGEQLVKAGLDVRFETSVTRVDKTRDGLLVTLGNEEPLEVDAVVYAIGRAPHTTGLGLDRVGVAIDERGAVVVDAAFTTSVPNIHAVGDVTNRLNLTPVALAEGHALADSLFGGAPRGVSYDNVPTAVFSIPPVATVGLTERQARERHGAVDVYRARFKPMRHTLSGRDEQTFMKLVVDRASQRVLGVHVVGEDGPEMIQGFAVALQCNATKADLDRTIGLHPTAAEELVTMRTRSPDP